MGTTRAEAPTRLLDLTRLVSRAGRAFTGIDRVEYAYLVHLLDAGPLWGLVRSSMGYLLLDPEGCAALKRQFTAGDWPAPDLLSRLGMEAEEMDMTGTLSPAAVQAKFHDLQEQHSFVLYVLWRGLW